MTRFQQLVVFVAAVLLALRAFFPVQNYQAYPPRPDAASTLFQLLGIVIIAAAAYVLAPDPNLPSLWSRVRKSLPGAILLAAWLAYLYFALLGLGQYGLAPTLSTVDWFPTTLAAVGLVLLLEISWRWMRVPGVARRVFWVLLALTAVSITAREVREYDGTLRWYLAYALSLAVGIGINALILYVVWLVFKGIAAVGSRAGRGGRAVETARKVGGWPLKAAGVVAWIGFGLWAFAMELAIVNKVAGFIGVVVAFVLAPVTFAAAPWYAGVAWGNWFPLIIGYGGAAAGYFLYWLGSTVAGDQ